MLTGLDESGRVQNEVFFALLPLTGEVVETSEMLARDACSTAMWKAQIYGT